MPKLRSGVILSLFAPLLLVGCGTAPTDNTNTPPSTYVPPVEQPQMPPQDGSSTMPMGDASSTMPHATGTGMMAPQPPPELTDGQKTELAAGEAAHKPSELTFHVSGGSFFYVPNQIKVKKGDKVKIIFDNVGGMHNFNIDEYAVKSKTVKTGETDTVEFTADKAGSFEYYCGVGKHRMMGQKGTLIVE